jgi:hypothetical protein
MAKKTERARKFGRPKELRLEDLPKRYWEMKTFLENYWGRVGLGLQRVREPDDVRAIFNLVPGIEWATPFRGHAICLIANEASQVTSNELRQTRRRYKDAVALYERLWREYLDTNEAAQRVTTALKGTISQFQDALHTFPIFLVMSLVARELRFEELTNLSRNLEVSARRAQKEQESVKKTLNAQEAWYARNEVVKFAENNRHDKTLINFARAMAGLPEWGWFHSRRTCEKIQDHSLPATPYQIFELLAKIVRGMRPLKLANLEKRVRDELLSPDADPVLRGYVTHHWHYLKDAIRHPIGVKKSELPYKIMDRFLYHCERPKTATEDELARQDQLV